MLVSREVAHATSLTGPSKAREAGENRAMLGPNRPFGWYPTTGRNVYTVYGAGEAPYSVVWIRK